MEGAGLPQCATVRIGGVGQQLQRAFHPPFGHRFAGVLAGLQPDGQRAIAHGQAVDGPAIERCAQHAVAHARFFGNARDEVLVPLPRIGGEIGKPRQIAHGPIADGQRAAVFGRVIAAVGAAPEFPVLADRGAIAGPAVGIGRSAKAADLQHQLAPRRAGDAEVEPLEKVRLMVLADGQPGAGPGDVFNANIARVEGGVDADFGHGSQWVWGVEADGWTVTVWPDWPGKPANSAEASCAPASWPPA